MPILTICSSVNFYPEVIAIQALLEARGFQVLIPENAERVKRASSFDVSLYRPWLGDAADYHKKTTLMRHHFVAVEKADAILVVNNQKNGIDNYIGGNVLIEMAIAFYQHKPLFILNDLPEQLAYLEEIIGMEPIVLNGDLSVIEKAVKLNFR